jgi:hypothetical protein
MRRHGDVPKPSTGYRIARLAADIYEFALAHELRDIALGGHSMRASIIWSYLESSAPTASPSSSLDQAPMVTNGFGIEGAALKETGAVDTPERLYATAGAIIRNQAALLDGSRRAFFSPSISDAGVAFNKAEALKMPAEYPARLLVDNGTQDWRDVITDLRSARYFRPSRRSGLR